MKLKTAELRCLSVRLLFSVRELKSRQERNFDRGKAVPVRNVPLSVKYFYFTEDVTLTSVLSNHLDEVLRSVLDGVVMSRTAHSSESSIISRIHSYVSAKMSHGRQMLESTGQKISTDFDEASVYSDLEKASVALAKKITMANSQIVRFLKAGQYYPGTHRLDTLRSSLKDARISAVDKLVLDLCECRGFFVHG